MKTLSSLVLGLIFLMGCTLSVGQPHRRPQYRLLDLGGGAIVLAQRGMTLQVTHTCTDLGRLYQTGVGLVADIRGAEPREFFLEPAVWGDREIQVTFQSLDQNDKVVGVYAEKFNTDRTSTTKTWIISNRRFGGSGGTHSSCPR